MSTVRELRSRHQRFLETANDLRYAMRTRMKLVVEQRPGIDPSSFGMTRSLT